MSSLKSRARARRALFVAWIVLTGSMYLSGCDPSGGGGPCQPLMDDGITVSAGVTTGEALLVLRPLSGSDRFQAGETSVTLRSDGPLLAIASPRYACDRIHLALGCERPHAGDLLGVAADQSTLTVGTTDKWKTIDMQVLGRWGAGEAVTLSNIGQWQNVYLVQLDALAVAPGQPLPQHTVRVDAHVEVKSCSANPPYDLWREVAASSLFMQRGPFCGDGMLWQGEVGQVGEVCDDGNDDSGDGCEPFSETYNANPPCRRSPFVCHPSLAATWLAWRCEGVPSQCAQILCTQYTDPGCDGVRGDAASLHPEVSAEARVVVNGRTEGDAPHRAEVSLNPQTRCVCEDTGWALRCDDACDGRALFCAVLTFPPASADLIPARWEGCRVPSDPSADPLACVVDNIFYDKTINAVFSRALPTPAPRIELTQTLRSTEHMQGLQAVAASTSGAAWAAVDVLYVPQSRSIPQLYYVAPGAAPDAAPLRLPSLSGDGGGDVRFLSISASDDGQRAWALASVQGRASWRGQPIEPPVPTSYPGAAGLVAIHINGAGDLLGVLTLRDEVTGGWSFSDAIAPRLLISRAASPTWSAVIAYNDISQGELILTAITDSGDKVWRQVLRAQPSAPIMMNALFTDAQGNVWVSTSSSSGTFTDAPWAALAGLGGSLLLQLAPDGSLRWVAPWSLSVGAITADGLGLWTLGYDLDASSPPLTLRRYDLDGTPTIDTPAAPPPFSVEDPTPVRLWPQEDGDLISSRRDRLGALVLSRWTPPDPLQPSATWTRRWIERVESSPSPIALSARALTTDPATGSLHVVGRFSSPDSEHLILPLAP